MKSSARNCFHGEVTELITGAVNDEVKLKLANGTIITSIITHESTLNLGLVIGAKAFALIKSSFVILATEMENVKVSTRNCLVGTVSNVKKGAVNSEVLLTLPGGESLTAIITHESVENLTLSKGTKATALFKASHVILGVNV